MDEFKKREKTNDPVIIDLKDPILGYDKIQVIGHAQDRLVDWGLTIDDALLALKSPDETDLPTTAGRERVRRHKTIRTSVDVVFEKLDDVISIVIVIKIERRLTRRGRK